MKVSVAICTWNRAKLLDQTLTQMRRLRIPEGVEWELLIINNNCTDHTEEVLVRHSANLPLRRLLEVKQGQSNARNCAVANARSELLIWTDDDVLVDEDWIASYVAAATAWPQASYFGGTVDYWFEVIPPRWLSSNLNLLIGHYALRNVDPSIIPMPKGETPFGANMAFRLDALKAFPFNTSLGLTKNDHVRGDESELFKRMREAGHVGVWVGPAKVRHFIPAERLTKQYIWEWSRGQGRTHARVYGLTDGSHLFGYPRWAVRKYVEKLIQAWVLNPFKGSAWMRAFLISAWYRGYMEEARDFRQRKLSASLSATSI